MTHTHIRPLSRGDPKDSSGYLLACEEHVCPTHRQICRRRHDDKDCAAVYGCGGSNIFYCKEAEHGCSRKFKCFDFRQ